MRTTAISVCLVVLLLAASGGLAQVRYPSQADSSATTGITPRVTINNRAASLQASLYPDNYVNRSVLTDQAWVTQNDSIFTSFWRDKGDSILITLAQLSGIDWVDTEIELYLVRYYPSLGSAEPMILPLGGIRQGALIEAVPPGCRMQLDIIYQFSRRLLGQAARSSNPGLWSVAGHPLMRPGPYGQDNLALLLALSAAERVIGKDSCDAAYRSAFWSQRMPGREIFERYLLSKWTLSETHPLAQWIAQEPTESELSNFSPAAQNSRRTAPGRKPVYIEGLPLKGQFGFATRMDDRGQFVVDKIDSTRLAWACGLRQGDIIRSVDGVRMRTAKELAERMLAGLDKGGATVSVVRLDKNLLLLLQPSATPTATPPEDSTEPGGGPEERPLR